MKSDDSGLFKNVQFFIYASILAVICAMGTSAYIKTHAVIMEANVLEKPELVKTGSNVFGDYYESKVKVSLKDNSRRTYYFKGEDAKKASSNLKAGDTISVPVRYDQLIFYDDFVSFAIGFKLPFIMIIGYSIGLFILFKSIQLVRRKTNPHGR